MDLHEWGNEVWFMWSGWSSVVNLCGVGQQEACLKISRPWRTLSLCILNTFGISKEHTHRNMCTYTHYIVCTRRYIVSYTHVWYTIQSMLMSYFWVWALESMAGWPIHRRCALKSIFYFVCSWFILSKKTVHGSQPFFLIEIFNFRVIFPEALQCFALCWHGLVYDETFWGPGNRLRMAGFGTHVTSYIFSCFLLDPWNPN